MIQYEYVKYPAQNWYYLSIYLIIPFCYFTFLNKEDSLFFHNPAKYFCSCSLILILFLRAIGMFLTPVKTYTLYYVSNIAKHG